MFIETACGRAKLACIFLLTLLFLMPQSLSAQGSGSIKGRVLDNETGDPLIGANVVIQNTSLGAPTDLAGGFTLHSVPAGKHTLRVSYIGYVEVTREVTVKENETLEQDFRLVPQAITGETVVVTAQAHGQMAAINQQLASNTITNVVSSDRIRELPDQSASAALSRLPGVSIMNGDQIVIRGIQAKNNIILVNGIQLPSTDLNTRSVDLGFISSNMLSSIEVIKALTPDMDANSIGGVVNLRLMEAPQNFHFDLLSQGNYNRQDRTTDNYKFWASASNRFFDDRLGVFVQGNADRSNDGNDQTTAGYTLYQDLPYGFAPYRMDNFTFNDQVHITTNYGASVILDYVLPHGKLILQNTLAHNLADNTDYKYYMDFTILDGLNYTLSRDKNYRNLLVNALQAEYSFGAVRTELTLSHSYSNKRTDIRYGDPGDNFGFANATDPHPYGVDASGNPINPSNLRETLTPDDVYKLQIDPNNSRDAEIANWATTRGEAFTEHLYNSTLDFTLPVTFSEDFSTSFKLGGKFARFTRNNDLEEYYKRTGDNDFYAAVADFIPGKVLTNTNPLLLSDIWNTNYTRGQYFLNSTYDIKNVIDVDQMDKFLPLASTKWVPGRHMANSERYDFNGAEMFSAGYAMGTFNIGPRLTVLGGVRYEHYNMKYNATFVYVTHGVDGIGVLFDTLNTVNRNDDNVLPNVQLRYRFTDWGDIRLAYTNSLVRPDYNAIMPNTYFEPGVSAQAGNPKLKPTLSKNYDASLSFHNNDIGLFTVGGFYKNLDNVFFATTIYYQNLGYYILAFPDSAAWQSLGVQAPPPSQRISTFINNPNPAHVRGIELEWQTHFWYLPRPLDALVLNINYARVWSDMDYLQLINTAVPYQVGRFTYYHYITTDTVRNARLLNQSDHVLNIALGVDYRGFSGRVSFNLQSNVITTVGARPEADQFTGNIYRWDLTLQQKLPIEGLSVIFDVQNLSHSPTKTYQTFSRIPGGPIGDNLVSTIYGPTNYLLSLRYGL
jgi:TonB-dependent receptor